VHRPLALIVINVAPQMPRFLLAAAATILAAFAQPPSPLSREEWGAPLVNVSQSGSTWTIAGRKHVVTLNANDLSFTLKAGPAVWSMHGSAAGDLRLRAAGANEDTAARLADAGSIRIAPYDTGEKTGVKIMLDQWRQTGTASLGPIALPVFLTLAFEGASEELVFSVAADESHGARVRQLDWPPALDAGKIDHTILNHYRGILLPRDWPQPYNPIRGDSNYPNDVSEIQSDVVECWSQPWWGFQKGAAALMVLIETPDDGAYQWGHPAGGPTLIGPRWRSQLGRLGYMRTGRFVVFDQGNYVDLAKRYRAHAIETGLWVPLRQKIARSPKVETLIGSIESRIGILRDIVPESRLFNKTNPERNYSVTPFAERAQQLRELRRKGIERFQVVLTGWPRKGYDREHPDGLPVAPVAGGWEGMKLLADTCAELGYTFTLHDQYRDYYVEAPSYSPAFAVHEEDASGQPSIFPGTRFGSWKEGRLSFLAAWDGGKQTYLSPRLMLGHLRKNYAGIFAHGIRPGGSYLDVFGYVPPDQDFNPEHPTTRTEAKREIARLYHWAREHLGIVGTEAGVDWTVPFTDYSSPLGPGKAGIPVPLFSLVYHDAVMTPYSPSGNDARTSRPNWLYGMLNGGPPRVSLTAIESSRAMLDQMTALHRRVALLAMTHHEFLDATRTRERSTFADGTTVTIDWEARTVRVDPELK
jgi:hypothetical protein